MNIFLDTSSLFKLYHNEVGTEDIGLLVTRADVQQVFLSKLARIEFASTVWKRVRMRNLTAEEAKAVIKEFNRNAIKYEFYEVSPKVLEIAENLVNKYGVEGLRTLDSIQLATAVLLKNDVDIFKTSDKLLEKLMLAEGLTTDI